MRTRGSQSAARKGHCDEQRGGATNRTRSCGHREMVAHFAPDVWRGTSAVHRPGFATDIHRTRWIGLIASVAAGRVTPTGGGASPSPTRGVPKRKGGGTIDSMTALTWALFALLAASQGVLVTVVVGAFSRLDSRIDVLRGEFSGRFDGLHEDIRELRAAVTNLDRRLTTAGG